MHSRLTQVVRPHLKWKQRTLLSSRVVTGISCSPLSGLKGIKTSVEFGDRTRDCSPGHAEKDGPHLAMMGTYCGFSGAGAPDGFPTRYDGELREPLMWCQGSKICMRVAMGSPSLLSSHGRGTRPQEALKKDSRGLSRVSAANPGFPQLVPVTSGSFSGCL